MQAKHAGKIMPVFARPRYPPVSIWPVTKRRVAAPDDRAGAIEYCS
jgi:hypothetical protein